MNKQVIAVGALVFLSLLSFSCACSLDKEPKPTEPETPVEAGSGEKDGYKLIWEDRFNEPVLNSSNWNIEVNGDGGGNAEMQYYRSQNVSIGQEPTSGKSCLVLTAKKESFSGKTVTSGRVNSMGKHAFKFGKIEASIKFPRTKDGIWPAFWMLGEDFRQVGWPKSGELDIVEMGHVNGIKSGKQDRYLNGACHWGQASGGNPSYAKHVTYGYDLQDDFHLFTLIWDDQSIKTYIDLDRYPDAKPYFEMSIKDASNVNAAGYYFKKEFFIVFNLAVGGNFPQIWDINKITGLASGETNMYVDYVKVYQKP